MPPDPLASRSGCVEHRLGRADEHLAEQSLSRAEPAVDRRPAEAELGRERLDVDTLAVQVAVERLREHVVAARGRAAAAARRRCVG